jgi:hypothetical protein
MPLQKLEAPYIYARSGRGSNSNPLPLHSTRQDAPPVNPSLRPTRGVAFPDAALPFGPVQYGV